MEMEGMERILRINGMLWILIGNKSFSLTKDFSSHDTIHQNKKNIVGGLITEKISCILEVLGFKFLWYIKSKKEGKESVMAKREWVAEKKTKKVHEWKRNEVMKVKMLEEKAKERSWELKEGNMN
jgi:hypothetical protein